MFFPLLRHLILTGILLVVGSGWSQNSVQLAIDVATGDVIASKNPATCLSPASTVKLFSTATAFQVLGSDYAPKTRIYIDGTIDSKGTVNGNLWIRGGGDVTIGSRYYNAEGIEDTLLRVWADTLL